MTAPGSASAASDPWAAHRTRAAALRARHPFAAEVLTLYLALTAVWERGHAAALAEPPAPSELPAWAVRHVLDDVVSATAAVGPAPLAAATAELTEGGRAAELLGAWLAGAMLAPAERYLARATLRGPLAALDAARACAADPAPRGERHCPSCGGLPQLSVRTHSGDGLISAGRRLACARCAREWSYPASSCPACGESGGGRRTVYAERRAGPVVVGSRPTAREDHDDTDAPAPLFPHLRVDACASCRRYLIDVDLGRDARAVPEVDELAALPLDLYATDRGLSKITPNLMGF